MLSFPLISSNFYRVALFATHAGVCVLFLLVLPPTLWLFVGFVVICWSMRQNLLCLKRLDTLKQLSFQDGDILVYQTTESEPEYFKLRGTVFSSPFLTILPLKNNHEKRHIPLFFDSANTDDLRRLRQLLTTQRDDFTDDYD